MDDTHSVSAEKVIYLPLMGDRGEKKRHAYYSKQECISNVAFLKSFPASLKKKKKKGLAETMKGQTGLRISMDCRSAKICFLVIPEKIAQIHKSERGAMMAASYSLQSTVCSSDWAFKNKF